MRTHKYRAFSKQQQKMYSVASLIFTDAGVRLMYMLDPTDESHKGITTDNFDDFVLMEYIGIPDRHNTDIFESDILHLRLGHDLLEVRWSVFGYRFWNSKKQDWQLVWAADLKRLEIVGNIWQPPVAETLLAYS